MRLPLIMVLGMALCLGGRANPIVVDHEERPIEMLAERVTIDVGPADSMVSGVYRFRQLADNHPQMPDKHVRVLLPVFLPEEKSDFKQAQPEASVVAVVNSKEYRPVESAPLRNPRDGMIRNFPRKTKLVFFAIYIPRTEIPEEFQVSITYRQPHIRSGFSSCAMYCPMIFPMAPVPQIGEHIISFRPATGQKLKLLSKHARVVREPDSTITVSAVHLENIVVKATPAAKR